MTTATSSARLKLLLLISVFLGPLFLAMLMYFNPQWFTPIDKNHHGELITPAQPLMALKATLHQGQALPDDLLTGRWTLLYWNNADCDLLCEADLFKMRQVRLSLGKDIERVQTIYLSSETKIGKQIEIMIKRHPKLITAYLENEVENPFAQQIGAHPQKNTYIIDPLGNLIMRYSSTATSKGLLKDLKKLLRVSRIG